jgi:hypothetical protein
MSFKINFFSIVILFHFLSLSAQEITIPFRNGNLWGICNEAGKVLIEPKFDQLEFPNSYENANDYMISKLNGLEGLIIDEKEILKPKYTSIYNDDGFFHVRSTENGSQQDILLPNGTSIFEQPFIKILSQYEIVNHNKLFHVLNQNLTESVFIYDMKLLKKAQVLYDNYHSISLIKTRNEITKVSQLYYLVKKTATSNLLVENWTSSSIPLEKINSGFQYLKEDEFLQFFANKYYSSKNNDYYSGSGFGKGEVMEAVEYVVSSDRMEDVPMSIPYEERTIISETQEFKEKHWKHNLVIRDSKLFLESYVDRNYNNKKIQEIAIEVPASEIKLVYGSFYFKKEKGSDSYSNFIRYQKNGKTIIIFPYNLNTKIEFDFLDELSFPIKENNTIKETVYLVGKKDKNEQLKYGLFSNVRDQFIGFEYDEIKNIQHYSNDGTYLFKVKKNNKFGVIKADGKILFTANYSDLKEVHNNYRPGTKVFQIQNNTKFGLIYLSNSEIKTLEPVFDYPIKGVIPNYPEYKNNKISGNKKNQKTISLIELKDESGKFMGYANFNGKHFFKD